MNKARNVAYRARIKTPLELMKFLPGSRGLGEPAGAAAGARSSPAPAAAAAALRTEPSGDVSPVYFTLKFRYNRNPRTHLLIKVVISEYCKIIAFTSLKDCKQNNTSE